MVSFRDYEIYLLFLLLIKFHGSGGVDVRFTQEPSNPSYFSNGSDANLVWDYTDPHNNIQSTLYSVLVNGAFVEMMVNDSRGVQEHPNIPLSYKGRVKIEGRATLVIKNINPGDNTKFRCNVFGSFIYKVESTVQLIVAESLDLGTLERKQLKDEEMTKLTEKEKWEILTDQTIETHQGTTRALFQPLSKPCYCWQLEDENLTQKWNGH